MKKTMISFLLLFFLLSLIPVSGFAESYTSDGWEVTFTKGKELKTNYIGPDSKTDEWKDNEITVPIDELEPGDDLTVEITLKNEYGDAADWYMWNWARESLENANVLQQGGYSYTLSYSGPGGNSTFYDSDRVGGEDAPSGNEGLKESTTSLLDYFYLDKLSTGGNGTVTLKVKLDGETQGNSYQRSQTKNAKIGLRFAVELPTIRYVNTGDSTNNLPLYIGMIVGGLVLLYFVLDGITDRIYFGNKRHER